LRLGLIFSPVFLDFLKDNTVISRLKTFFVVAIVLLVLLYAAALTFGPDYLEARTNRIQPHDARAVSKQARLLHKQLVIGDWHTDTLLWRGNLMQHSQTGHVDLPRLQAGNVALQMFTTVSKVPLTRNHESNVADGHDAITLQAMLQSWPLNSWDSLLQRTLFQAQRLHDLVAQAPERIQLIRTQSDLQQLMQRRAQGEKILGALLGVEGLHALEGQLDAVDVLYANGFRMLGLQHFFDNALGGSLHGEHKGGLTPFGREVIQRMNELHMIIDLAHSSETVASDVLALSARPVVVSHTGFKGNCDKPRNFSDALMRRIADAGGLIAVGFWDRAICDASPEGIVASLRYGIDNFGVDHIALGSDFDGGTTTHIDASELVVLTDIMLQRGFSETEIRKVMGGNMLRFLSQHLPPEKSRTAAP
jgi:microsomal dipeptidase-like Zn-dependent dipeptidase